MANQLQPSDSRRPWRSVRPAAHELAVGAYRDATAGLKSTPVTFRLARCRERTDSTFERLLVQIEKLAAMGVLDVQLMTFENRLREFRGRLVQKHAGTRAETNATLVAAFAIEQEGNTAEQKLLIAAECERPAALRRLAAITRREIAMEVSMVEELEAEADRLDERRVPSGRF